MGALKYNFDVENVSSINFVRKLTDSAGKCLDCGLTSCKTTDRNFADFSSTVFLERTINGPLKCSPNKPKEPETTSKPDIPVQLPEDSKMVMAGHSNHAASSLLTILTSFLLLKIWL
jgi:hypothetical protein